MLVDLNWTIPINFALSERTNTKRPSKAPETAAPSAARRRQTVRKGKRTRWADVCEREGELKSPGRCFWKRECFRVIKQHQVLCWIIQMFSFERVYFFFVVSHPWRSCMPVAWSPVRMLFLVVCMLTFMSTFIYEHPLQVFIVGLTTNNQRNYTDF